MHLGEAILTAGLLIGLCGAVLTVRQVGRRMREFSRQHYMRQVEEMADLACQVLLFGGMALLQIGSVIDHMSRNATSIPWFTVLSGMGMVLLFGFQLGRLFMRWQVRKILMPQIGAPSSY